YEPDPLAERVADQVQRAIAFYRKNPQYAPRSADKMDAKLTEQQQRDAERFRVLEALYELTGGRPSPHAMVPFADVFQRAGVTYEVGHMAFVYLQHERLVIGHPEHHLGITHAGIKERETAIRGEGRIGTPHFPQPVVNHVVQNFNAPVYGAVQTGDHNTAQVKNVAGAQVAELVPLLEQLHAHANNLPPEHREHAVGVVAKLREEATSEKPNPLLLGGYAKALSAFVTLAPTLNAVLGLIAGAGA
ncbi:MAG: hypothetical protein ACRELB_01815, partial [Polyangiaceae bacterium]